MSATDTGVLYCNDNLERLPELPSESVDLIYLDPPFFSNRVYEVIWGDEAEVRSFEDRWDGGIQHYIGWMRERVVELRRVLKPTGSLYLHCDPHASHYLKVMLDDIFGGANFRNEIVWKRTGAHGGSRRYGPVHDLLFLVTKSESYTWNQQFGAYDAAYLARFSKVDEHGRKFQDIALTGPGIRGGESGVAWQGYDPTAAGRHWAIPSFLVDLGAVPAEGGTTKRLDTLNAAGRVYFTRRRIPRLRFYTEDARGIPLQDVWTDIAPINSQARERLGYPTQKPESLLERILSASSNPGDIVLDPFCGCGTTVAVAERLKREWIGIDISATAINIMRRRLWNQSRTVPMVVDVPDTVESLKKLKPFEFQNWVIDTMNGSHSPRRVHDMGIDGYSFFTKDPIQVKQSEHVGRNVVDNFETAMRRGKHDTGYIIAFSFTKGAVEEVARARTDGLSIKLVKVTEVLLLAKRPGAAPTKLGPQPEGDVLPLPPMRKPSELPSAEQLIASAKAEAG